MEPGAQEAVSLVILPAQFGQSLADRIFGQLFFGDTTGASDASRRDQTRHQIIDQLTYDPMFGNLASLDDEGPVILAWGRTPVLDVQVEGQSANRVANILFYVPTAMGISGKVNFTGQLIRNTMTGTDAAFFNKDPSVMTFGQGSVTMSYRPIAFEGTLSVERVRLAAGFGPDQTIGGGGVKVEPIPDVCLDPKAKHPPACPKPLPPDQFDGIPEIEVFDRTGAGSWHRLPHIGMGQTYDLMNPARYADPETGAVLVRFVNERQDPVNIYLTVSIEGTVK